VSLDKQKVVKVSQLKFLSISFKKDVYSLAKWIAANDVARSEKYHTCHTTINGLCTYFCFMTGISRDVVESRFKEAGFYLGAIIEDDEN